MQQISGGSSIALRLAVELPDGNRTSLVITKSMLKSGAVLGRAGSADLAINGGKISRQHAKIYQEDRKLMVKDMGSTNGTKLNGKPLRPHQPTQINSSSRLELGSVKIKLGGG